MSAFGRLPMTVPTSRPTRAVQSNVLAEGFRQADPRFAMGQYDRAGMSRGAGTAYAGSAEAGQALGQARTAASDIGYEDSFAERQRRFTESQRGGEYADAMTQQRLRDQAQNNSFMIGNAGRALQREGMFNRDRLSFLNSAYGALSGLLR
jgi:hypothetical protein